MVSIDVFLFLADEKKYPMEQNYSDLRVVALAGGVGGARLVYGLAQIISPGNFSVIVNTGDDFEHLGLSICPDLDTVLYTLAELEQPQAGWGIADDTHECLGFLRKIGAPDWFQLGDRDLAVHLQRSEWLRSGMRLTDVTARLAAALGVKTVILPMSDQPCRTMVLTDQGEMDFQTYFVKHGWQPRLLGLAWQGSDRAVMTGEVQQAIQQADLVVICPSNPFVSIDPILNLPGVRKAVRRRPCVAVSPIIGGKAVKGPAGKMFTELGIQPSALAVAEHYRNLVRVFVLDEVDGAMITDVERLGMRAFAMHTWMKTREERVSVAAGVLSCVQGLLSRGV